VELCGVCGTDLKHYAGGIATPYPMILGHEIVGRIEALGERARVRYGVAAGDRVLVESSIPCWSCEACRSGAYRLCPTKRGYGTRTPATEPPGLWGGISEVTYIAPGSILHRLPDSIDAATGVGVPLLANGLMWLIRQGGLRAGDRVLIQGCGPQGLAAAMAASASGAADVVVTGLARDTARLAFAADVGARTVMVDPAWSREERVGAVGTGFDVVLDVSGSPEAVAGAPAHVRAQGTFVLAGLVGRDRTVALASDELVWREIRVQGVLTKDEAAIRSALGLVESHPDLARRLGRLISHTYPLEATADAILAFSAGVPGFVKAAVAPGARPAS
jgi:alcohol dehydrogenase